MPPFGVGGYLLWRLASGGKMVHDISVELVVGRVHVDETLVALGPSQCLMHRDARKPGAKLRPTFELPEMFVGAHVSFLHNVFGFGIVSQDAVADPVQQLVVAANDDLEKGGIPG